MCLVCSVAQAQCVGQITSINKAGNGGILVSAEFSVDGQDLGIDRKTYFPKNIKDLTPAQVKTALENGLKRQCRNLIIQHYKKANAKSVYVESIEAMQSTEFAKLQQYEEQIKAITVTQTDLTIKLDTDGDNYYDQAWTIKPDGTKSVVNITPELMP